MTIEELQQLDNQALAQSFHQLQTSLQHQNTLDANTSSQVNQSEQENSEIFMQRSTQNDSVGEAVIVSTQQQENKSEKEKLLIQILEKLSRQQSQSPERKRNKLVDNYTLRLLFTLMDKFIQNQWVNNNPQYLIISQYLEIFGNIQKAI